MAASFGRNGRFDLGLAGHASVFQPGRDPVIGPLQDPSSAVFGFELLQCLCKCCRFHLRVSVDLHGAAGARIDEGLAAKRGIQRIVQFLAAGMAGELDIDLDEIRVLERLAKVFLPLVQQRPPLLAGLDAEPRTRENLDIVFLAILIGPGAKIFEQAAGGTLRPGRRSDLEHCWLRAGRDSRARRDCLRLAWPARGLCDSGRNRVAATATPSPSPSFILVIGDRKRCDFGENCDRVILPGKRPQSGGDGCRVHRAGNCCRRGKSRRARAWRWKSGDSEFLGRRRGRLCLSRSGWPLRGRDFCDARPHPRGTPSRPPRRSIVGAQFRGR
ncbi:hypothetical protein ACG873_01350 (plasmid) [Mesorhizobium sp. AaZ16]|uniref:hypothetical protein n=1 Tax=Mesorhizobium sp. AaZ16 TaxID=3402289 RepID=UPI00374E54B0